MEEQNENIFDPMNTDERIVVNLLCTEIRTLRLDAESYCERARAMEEEIERLKDSIEAMKSHDAEQRNKLDDAKQRLSQALKEVECLKAEIAVLRYEKAKSNSKKEGNK